MEFIDAHAHLIWPQFDSIIDEVIQRSIDAHVNIIINVNVHNSDIEKGATLQARYPGIIKNISGIHPEFALDPENNLETFKKLFIEYQDQQLAIGEIGLDYLAVKDHEQRHQTELIFREALDFAVSIKKPVVIHCRNAEKQALNILNEYPDLSGVLLHCFGGPEKFIKEALEKSWYFTIPTSIAFKKIHQDLAQIVPLNRILLESDAPFLAPTSEIKINEPQYVIKVAEQIAEIKNVSLEEVGEITTQNAHQFFNF